MGSQNRQWQDASQRMSEELQTYFNTQRENVICVYSQPGLLPRLPKKIESFNFLTYFHIFLEIVHKKCFLIKKFFVKSHIL